MIHRCARCNLPYTPLTGNQKLCSKCRRQGYYIKKEDVEKTCQECLKIFTTNNKRKIYCSAKCRANADKRKKQKVEKICQNKSCQKVFYSGDDKQKYCCNKCYIEAKNRRARKNG